MCFLFISTTSLLCAGHSSDAHPSLLTFSSADTPTVGGNQRTHWSLSGSLSDPQDAQQSLSQASRATPNRRADPSMVGNGRLRLRALERAGCIDSSHEVRIHPIWSPLVTHDSGRASREAGPQVRVTISHSIIRESRYDQRTVNRFFGGDDALTIPEPVALTSSLPDPGRGRPIPRDLDPIPRVPWDQWTLSCRTRLNLLPARSSSDRCVIASGLQTARSVADPLRELKDSGYEVGGQLDEPGVVGLRDHHRVLRVDGGRVEQREHHVVCIELVLGSADGARPRDRFDSRCVAHATPVSHIMSPRTSPGWPTDRRPRDRAPG
jgi:hypothetical protein